MLRPAKLNENLYIVQVYIQCFVTCWGGFVSGSLSKLKVCIPWNCKPWINDASELPHEKTLLDVAH